MKLISNLRLLSLECFHLPAWQRAVGLRGNDADVALKALHRRAVTVCQAASARHDGLAAW